MSHWHLAIETSGRAGSFALLDADQLVAESSIEASGRTAADFAVHLSSLLEGESLASSDIELVSVAAGPGSFTGLRIGVTAAKTFCFASDAQLAAVSTLDAIALAALTARGAKGRPRGGAESLWISVAMNAYRGQVFRSQLVVSDPDSCSPRTWLVERPPAAIDSAQWRAELDDQHTASHTEYGVAGDAVRLLGDELPTEFHDWTSTEPLARYVGQLGWQLHLQDEHVNYWSLVPNYLRASAAEEKAAARSKA